MPNYKLVITYDGTRYSGWQRLKDNDNTIQYKIESVLSAMTEEKVEIIGSGRTDRGAHAFCQVASFHTNKSWEAANILEYLNKYLPEDIVIMKAEEVDERFHARYHVKSKKYLYKIRNSNIPTVFERKYSYYYPDAVDIVKMKRAAALLIGEHEFRGFSSEKKKGKSTIRCLYSIDIRTEDGFILLMFHGSGFLYNMVRIIAGTLLEIGAGIREENSITEILAGGVREMAGPTLPAQGLFLYDVEY